MKLICQSHENHEGCSENIKKIFYNGPHSIMKRNVYQLNLKGKTDLSVIGTKRRQNFLEKVKIPIKVQTFFFSALSITENRNGLVFWNLHGC